MQFLLIVVVGIMLAWSAPAGAQNLPTVSPGGSVDLSNGTECAPNSEASVFITPQNGNPIRMGAALIDERGHFNQTLSVPTLLPDGPAMIQVDCGLGDQVLAYSIVVGDANSSPIPGGPIALVVPGAIILGGAAFMMSRKKGDGSTATSITDNSPTAPNGNSAGFDPSRFEQLPGQTAAGASTAGFHPEEAPAVPDAPAPDAFALDVPAPSAAAPAGFESLAGQTPAAPQGFEATAPPAAGEFVVPVEAPPAAPASNDPLADLLPPPGQAAPETAPFAPEPVSMDGSVPQEWTAPAGAPDAFDTTAPIQTPDAPDIFATPPAAPEAFAAAPAPTEAPVVMPATEAPAAPVVAAAVAAPVAAATVAVPAAAVAATQDEQVDEEDDGTDYWVWDVTTPNGPRKRIAAVTPEAFYLHELDEEQFVATLQKVSEYGPDAALAGAFYRFSLDSIVSAERIGNELVINAGTADSPRNVHIDMGDEAKPVTELLQKALGPIRSTETSGPAPMMALGAAEPAPQPNAPIAMPTAAPDAVAAADDFAVDAPPVFAPPPSENPQPFAMGPADQAPVSAPDAEAAGNSGGPIPMGPAN